MVERCTTCGKFMRYEPGASWAQSWSTGYDGSPDLHDPRWQCAPCTETYGPLSTNCAYPERYSGVVATATETTDGHR
jgi:hypothetical protein